MRHRHIDNVTSWTPAAVDSVIERGDLPDWRELFRAVKTDAETARCVLMVASHNPDDGAFFLASRLVERFHPGLAELKLPAIPNDLEPRHAAAY